MDTLNPAGPGPEAENIEVSKPGSKAQQIAAVAATTLGALLKAGLVSAGIVNPALLGVTLFSALLPSLFAKKRKAVVVTPAAAPLGLLTEAAPPVPRVYVQPDERSSRLASAGMVLLQVSAILTAAGAWLDVLPQGLLGVLPEGTRDNIMLGAAALAIITPGLQRLGTLLKG